MARINPIRFQIELTVSPAASRRSGPLEDLFSNSIVLISQLIRGTSSGTRTFLR
jgi:hypothetical protein